MLASVIIDGERLLNVSTLHFTSWAYTGRYTIKEKRMKWLTNRQEEKSSHPFIYSQIRQTRQTRQASTTETQMKPEDPKKHAYVWQSVYHSTIQQKAKASNANRSAANNRQRKFHISSRINRKTYLGTIAVRQSQPSINTGHKWNCLNQN